MPDLKEKIRGKLREILDPELLISIVDLGLVYDIKEEGGAVEITMTLTTIGCPLFGVIEREIKNKLQTIKGVRDVKVKLVFEPPWSMERLTEQAKATLGIG